MMKPRFEDFMDFVRRGESDSKLLEQLRAHPEADTLLAQARFIWRMVGIHADARRKSSPGGFDLPGFARKGRTYKRKRVFLKTSVLENEASLDPWATDPLIDQPVAGRLGSIVGIIVGEHVQLDYVSGDGRPSAQAELFSPLQDPSNEILIHDEMVTITAPSALHTGDALRMYFQHSDSGRPASGLEILFMPEIGPFARFNAHDDGKLDLPLSEQSGVLRIETDTPRFLALRIERASNF